MFLFCTLVIYSKVYCGDKNSNGVLLFSYSLTYVCRTHICLHDLYQVFHRVIAGMTQTILEHGILNSGV